MRPPWAFGGGPAAADDDPNDHADEDDAGGPLRPNPPPKAPRSSGKSQIFDVTGATTDEEV